MTIKHLKKIFGTEFIDFEKSHYTYHFCFCGGINFPVIPVFVLLGNIEYMDLSYYIVSVFVGV